MDYEPAQGIVKELESNREKLEKALEEWRIEYMEAAAKGGQNLALRLRVKAAIYHNFGDERMADVYSNIARSGMARPRGLGSRVSVEIQRFGEVKLPPALNGSHK